VWKLLLLPLLWGRCSRSGSSGSSATKMQLSQAETRLFAALNLRLSRLPHPYPYPYPHPHPAFPAQFSTTPPRHTHMHRITKHFLQLFTFSF